jgi:hypothetical protein
MAVRDAGDSKANRCGIIGLCRSHKHHCKMNNNKNEGLEIWHFEKVVVVGLRYATLFTFNARIIYVDATTAK